MSLLSVLLTAIFAVLSLICFIVAGIRKSRSWARSGIGLGLVTVLMLFVSLAMLGLLPF